MLSLRRMIVRGGFWIVMAALGQVVFGQAPSGDLRGIFVDYRIVRLNASQSQALNAAIRVPGVDGVMMVMGWSDIEPSLGQFDWSSLDQWMATAVSLGKKVELSVTADFSTIPPWLFQPPPTGAGATPLFFSFVRKPTDTTCLQGNFAAPWDPAFLAQWDAMLVALSAHLKSTGAYNNVVLLRLTGINKDSDELHLPSQSTGPSCATDNVATYLEAGYRPSLLLKGWDGTTNSFKKSFGDKSFSVAIIANAPSPFPPIAEDGSILTAPYPDEDLPLLTLANQKFPGHLVIQNNSLYPGLAAQSQTIQSAQALGTYIAFQTNENVTAQGADCGTKGDGPVVPCTAPAFLEELETGIYPLGPSNGLRAQYLEVFPLNVNAFPNETEAAHLALAAPVIAHAADGNQFQTTVLLTNSGTSPAAYTLRFNDEQGNIPTTRFELASGSLTGTIPAGGSATIRTAGLGTQTVQGWAELTAPTSVKGSVVYSQKTGLPSIQEGTSTVGSLAGEDFFVPFDNASAAVTSMALTNPGIATANVTVTLRYSDGTSETLPYPALQSRHHQSFRLPGQFPHSANRAGVAEFVSDAPLAIVVFRFNSTGAFTALDAGLGSASSATVTSTLAHAADGNSFKTEVLLTNAATTPAPYSLQFDDGHGNPQAQGFQLELGSLTGTIPAGQSVTIRTSGLGPQTVGGWAELTAPASVAGSVIYSQKTSLPSVQEGTTPVVLGGSMDFFVPFDNTAGAVTSMALTNPGAAAANITVTLRYSDGATETDPFAALPTRNHEAFAIPTQFPNSSNRAGVAEFVSDSPLSVVAFRFNSTGAFTAFDSARGNR